MKYDLNHILNSFFALDDLSSYPNLHSYIISLRINISHEKIISIRSLLYKYDLPWYLRHHIKIRLELLEDIINSFIS